MHPLPLSVRCALLLVLLAPALAFGQAGTLRGRVTEAATGQPIPGASVVLVETQTGTATDADGRYELETAPGTYTLAISFIGFRRQSAPVTVSAGATVERDAALEEDLLGLDEVVVTGQGAGIEKRRLSTTIDVITPRQLEATPSTRLDQLLQAQLPAAQVRFSSGQPGTASMIRSRGPISAFSATTPVIYVDGVRVDNLNTSAALSIDTGGAQSSALPDIPVENIERIEFIKGGAATTLYGSDAANGVIQIFTKRGLPGRAQLRYESELGWQEGTTDFLRYGETADLLYRPGLVQQHRLSGSGGSQSLSYSFSGSMYEDNGFRLGNEQVKYGLRTTLGATVSPALRYTGTFGFSSSTFNRDTNANNGLAAFTNLEGGVHGDLGTMEATDLSVLGDSLERVVGLYDFAGDTKRFQTSQQMEFSPGRDVTLRTVVGLDYRVNTEEEIQSPNFLSFVGLPPTSSTITEANRRFLGLTLEATAQHQGSVGDFSFVSTAGGQVFRDEDRQDAIVATNIAQGTTSVNNAADATAIDFERIVANYGFYVQENIGFRDRYFIEGGLRVDANSAFGEEIGAIAYPKVGLAYALSEESFFQGDLLSGLVSELKLRANLGYAGKFPAPFSNERLVNSAAYLGDIAYTFGQVGNADLKPERVRTWEVGGDVSLFSDLITAEITYYNARTEDALFTVPFLPTSGRGAQLFNVGVIENKGWEVNTSVLLSSSRDLDLRLNASLNTLDNVVVDNGGTTPFNIGGFTFLGQWIEEGKPVGYLRGSRPSFDANGNLVDIEQNADLGSPLPDVFGNVSLSATLWGRLRFLATADYQMGAQGAALDDVLRFFNGVQDDDRFPRAPDGSIPALDQGSFFDLAGVWIENTDFFKVRLLSISYTLPERLFAGTPVRTLDVGVRVVNPFNFASSSFDPEVTGDNGQSGAAGLQDAVNLGVFGYGTESPPRQFLLNLRVGL